LTKHRDEGFNSSRSPQQDSCFRDPPVSTETSRSPSLFVHPADLLIKILAAEIRRLSLETRRSAGFHGNQPISTSKFLLVRSAGFVRQHRFERSIRSTLIRRFPRKPADLCTQKVRSGRSIRSTPLRRFASSRVPHQPITTFAKTATLHHAPAKSPQPFLMCQPTGGIGLLACQPTVGIQAASPVGRLQQSWSRATPTYNVWQ
jgi:hypothetical protein